MRFCGCFCGVTITLLLNSTTYAQLAGDVNCDEVVSGSDASELVRRIFDDGVPLRNDCPSADVNADGRISAADTISVLQRLPPRGPRIVFFGIAGADGTVLSPVERLSGGRAVYQRPAGSGFQVVVEAIPGESGASVGRSVFNFNPNDPDRRPDLQAQVSAPLGDGDEAVCTNRGVPGFGTQDFSRTQEIADALNDLGCVFRANANRATACTIDAFGTAAFVSPDPRLVQFCFIVSAEKSFPLGETTFFARVRDTEGNVGPLGEIIVRVGDQPVPTSTPSASRTPTNTRTPTRTSTSAASLTPTLTQMSSRTPTATRTGFVFTPTRTIVGGFSPTPTWSPTQTRTETVTGTPPPSLTATRTESPTWTIPPTQTRTETATGTPPPSLTATRTESPTWTIPPTQTRTPSRTPTQTLTPTATETFTATITGTRPATSTPTATSTRTRTGTATTTATPSPTDVPGTHTRTETPSRTASATRTRTPTQTRSPTWTVPAGDTATPTLTATGSLPPTLTPTRTDTATRSPSPTPSATPPPSRTPTGTRTPFLTPTLTGTRTASETPTVTQTPSATSSPPFSPTPSFTRTATGTRTASQTPLPSQTPTRTGTPTNTATHTETATPTGTPTASASRTSTRTFTVSPTPSATPTATDSRTPTITRTPSRTPTATNTATVTPTPTITRTPTATIPPEPVITYFGLIRADDTILSPIGVTGDGTPIFERFFGSGFSVVVEGRRGGTNAQLDANTFSWSPSDPSLLPGVQILVSRALGNGSETVCDDAAPNAGGVPATDPPVFDGTQAVANAVNDLSCRFKDGIGLRRGRDALDACTMSADGLFRFVNATTTLQYCGLINEPLSFPLGDTLLTVRIRDVAGNISATRRIVVRITSL